MAIPDSEGFTIVRVGRQTSETYAKLYNRGALDGNLECVRQRLVDSNYRAEAERAFARFEHYVAYGSNLNQDQMLMRCPSSTATHTLLVCGGRLTFRSNHGWTGVADIADITAGANHIAVAPMTTDPTVSLLPVQLYRLELEDMVALDVFEGYQPFGDSFYTRTYFSLTLPDGRQARSMTYKMCGGDPSPPDKLYLNVIRDGYTQRGLPTGILDEAVSNT